jgi:hypothetical protein
MLGLIRSLCSEYYWRTTQGLERTCLWQLDVLFKVMPYKMDLPRHPNARSHVIDELCLTCERRALAIFQALVWLLPLPLMAVYLTATCDATLIILMMGRLLVSDTCKQYLFSRTSGQSKKSDGGGSPKSSKVRRSVSVDDLIPHASFSSPRSRSVANCLALFGIFIHVFQFVHFFNRTTLVSSPYGFCSNIFVFLVTGFISHSFWCTVVLCIAKSFLISLMYLAVYPSLNDMEIGYFYGYWCSCAIVLTVLTPVHLETVGRIIAEGQATTFKKHMNDLLRASFDACVWVDDKMVVIDADPKLDSMFGRSMKHTSLLEFVKIPESAQFETNVNNSIENQATSLHHVTFSTDDQNTVESTRFDVDLYITSKLSYWSREDQHHLVGIRLRPNAIEPVAPAPDYIAPDSSPRSSWECPECHCVNFSKDSDNCILCGYRGAIDFGCRTILELPDEWNDVMHHPQSELGESLFDHPH